MEFSIRYLIDVGTKGGLMALNRSPLRYIGGKQRQAWDRVSHSEVDVPMVVDGGAS